ncbi:MAG: PAS domain S-box protein [Candidatus Korobacteraceae bacterium]
MGTATLLLLVEGLGPNVPIKTPVAVFLIPILLSAYVGGLAPGLLTTALAILTTDYFLLPPVYSWHVTNRTDVVKLMALGSVGGLVSFLMESRRRTKLSLATVQRESSLPSTESKARGGLWFLLTCLVAVASISHISVVRMYQDAAWVDHTHQVISDLRLLLATVTDGETSQRGYIITGQPSYVEPYRSAVAREMEAFRQLRDLTADNPLQQRRLNALEPLIAQRMAEFDEGIELLRRQGLEAAQREFLTGKGELLHDRIRQAVAEMEETESMLLREREARSARAVVVTEAVIIGTGLLALILGGIALFLVRQGFAASRLSEAELEQRVSERTDELAQANVRLHDSMERLSLAQNAAHAGTWEWDPQKNATEWSEELWALYGLEPHSCKPSHEAWRQIVHPDDLANLDAAMEQAVRQASELNVEWRTRGHDGSERWLMSRAHPIRDASGQVLKFVGMTFDVTEHKRVEEARATLAAIVDSSDDAIIGKTLDGFIASWNAGAQRLHGFTAQEAIGQSISIIIPPDRQEETKQILSTIAAGGRVERLDSVRLRKNKTEVEVSVTVSPIRDAAGRTMGASTIAHDITERKYAEQQARLYNLLVHQSRDIILFIRAQDGRIVGANAAAETAYGYTREELLALRLYDLRPSESPEAIRNQLHEADVHGVLFEAIHQRKDGSTFPVEVSATGETIDGTRTILSVVRNITERKRTEAKARQSEQLYHGLFDHMSEGLAYCRMVFENGEPRDFVYLAVNRAFEALTGLKHVAGRRVTEVIPGIREADPGLLETYARVALTGKAEKFEVFVGGLEKWFSISTFSPDKGFFVAVFDVITDRKRAEAALRKSRTMFEKLFEFTPDAIVTVDSRGCIVQLNAQAERSFGYSRTELMGQPVEFLVPELYRVAHAGHRQKYAATPVARPMGTGLELYGRRKDGSEFPADIQLNTIETDEGQLVLTVTRDVTERRGADQEIRRLTAELEQRVRDRTAQLESSNKELEAFAYSVSHDLRAPIRHLSAFSESLRERSYEKLDERGRHYLDNIHASSQQMGTLIDDLLKFSRLGRAGMSKADVALEPLMQEVRRELEPEAGGRNIVWKVSSLPTIYADRALLRQVLVNLMSNAVKYTRGRQEARIEIGCTNETPGERVIFIRDNGVGFEMAYVDKLFQVFQRLHTKEFEGTGIGLANVRRIVERHGGRVWAEGVSEQGATFYFSIPTRGGG